MSKAHLDSLDGLRAFAIILVFLRHLTNDIITKFPDLIPQGDFLFSPLNIARNGAVGVDLFFVLSGFLIGRTFLRDEKLAYMTFVKKRALRILPAYYTVLLFCILGIVYTTPPDALASYYPSFLYHLVLFQDYFPANINGALWSLGVEEKFYLIIPFFIMAAIRFRFRPIATLVLLVLLAGFSPVLRYLSYLENPQAVDDPWLFFRSFRSMFHHCLDPLFLGTAIAFAEYYAGQRECAWAKPLFWCGFALSGLFLLGHDWARVRGFDDAVIVPSLVAVLFALTVAGAVFGGAPKWLGHVGLKHIAKISYSLYLVHMPVLVVAMAFAARWTENSVLQLIFFVILSIFGAWGVSVMLYNYVEKPFLKIKDTIK